MRLVLVLIFGLLSRTALAASSAEGSFSLVAGGVDNAENAPVTATSTPTPSGLLTGGADLRLSYEPTETHRLQLLSEVQNQRYTVSGGANRLDWGLNPQYRYRAEDESFSFKTTGEFSRSADLGSSSDIGSSGSFWTRGIRLRPGFTLTEDLSAAIQTRWRELRFTSSTRRDRGWTAGGSLSLDVTRDTNIEGELGYERNDSSDNSIDYQGPIAGLTLATIATDDISIYLLSQLSVRSYPLDQLKENNLLLEASLEVAATKQVNWLATLSWISNTSTLATYQYSTASLSTGVEVRF